MGHAPLHERLLAAAGERTYRVIGELTQTHPESVRRYMQGQAPSAEFLTAFCGALGINGDWLLTGRGPMKARDMRASALAEAGAGDLLAAMAATIEKLAERVDRLELFVQGVDVRLRAGAPAAQPAHAPEGQNHVQSAPHLPIRVRLVADALAQRPHPDAH